MNIFARELKANFKSLLIWSGIIVVFVIMGVSKFSAFASDPSTLKILEDLPQALLDVFQMNAFNLGTVTGFYGIMYSYFGLIAALFAVMLGSDIISKEERDKTVEFSLTLPIQRHQLITGKLLAAVVNCIVLMLVIWGASLAFTASFNPDQAFYTFLSLIILTLFIVQMIFLALGILLGCAMKEYKQASSLAVALLMGTYFISIIAGLSKNLAFLKYFSPFKYFNPLTLLNESKIDPLFVLLSLGIIAASLIGAYFTYARRDLYI